jgi:hypothetical protein
MICGDAVVTDDDQGGPALICTAVTLASATGLPLSSTIKPIIAELGAAAALPKIADSTKATANPRLPFSRSFRSQCAEDGVTCASVDAEHDNRDGPPVTKSYFFFAGNVASRNLSHHAWLNRGQFGRGGERFRATNQPPSRDTCNLTVDQILGRAR